MGFLQSKPSEAEDNQLDDLYTMFKCNKDQNILAENLQNALMVISGLRDESQEIENDVNNKQWMMAGVYEEQTGLFFFRENEHVPIQNHFKLMALNRMQQKKGFKEFSHKSKAKEVNFQPKTLNKSKFLAEQFRLKKMQGGQASVVEILLNPDTQREKAMKLELLKREKQAKEDEELTLKPKTNKRMNDMLFYDDQALTSGDRNLDLYQRSKLKEKVNKQSSDYWYEKEAGECKFQPTVNKGILYGKGETAPQNVNQVKGTDAVLKRMKKAREEAEFKKRMTERSDFSASVGVKKAKKKVKEGAARIPSNQFNMGIDNSK